MRRQQTATLLAMMIIALAQHGCSRPHKAAQIANGNAPPPAAVVLFDGHDESHWIYMNGGGPTTWPIVGDAMEVHGGNIVTKDKFGDFTLHVEFWCPNLPPNVKGQGRGNSGVYLQDRYEIQVLDSYGVNPIGLGDCGAIYNQKIPDVNACRPPEQWQTYDIAFRSARFDASGKKTTTRASASCRTARRFTRMSRSKSRPQRASPNRPSPGRFGCRTTATRCAFAISGSFPPRARTRSK